MPTELVSPCLVGYFKGHVLRNTKNSGVVLLNGESEMKKVVVMVLAAGVLMTPPVKADPVSQELWRARAESVYNRTWAEFDYRNYKSRLKASKKLVSASRRALSAYSEYDLATNTVIASEARISKYGVRYYGLDASAGETKARLR